MKKVLFVTYDGLTDPLGQSQILPYFKGLAAKGHDVTILSSEKPMAFEKNKAIIEDLCEKAGIKWEYTFYTKNPAVLSTFLDLRRMKKIALQLHKQSSFDIVHCRTVITTSVGLALQNRGAKFIFDIRGFWADERVDGKLWDLKNPLYRRIYSLFKKKEEKAYLNSDQVITLTQNAKNELIKQFNLSSEKIDVVPCTVDLDHFQWSESIKKESDRLKKELKLSEHQPIVCYSGSLGTRYLIEEMLHCFSTLKKSYTNAKFLVVTHSNVDELISKAEELNLGQDIVTTSTDYTHIPAYIALADIALYFIYPGNSGKAVSPTKQAEFLGLGIPIISNSGIGDTEQILVENEVGLIVENFSEPAYQKIVERIPSIMDKPKTEIINIAEKYFNLEKGIATYNEVYRRL